MLRKFLNDPNALEMFTTGPAGSGKTTWLHGIVEQLIEDKVPFKVMAYTHKAKEVLISKLPEGTPCYTLHSVLKKRPGVNELATSLQSILTSRQYGKPEHDVLWIIDEFSFVGEADYFSIGQLQDELELEASVTTYKCNICKSDLLVDECPNCNSDNITEIIGDIPKPLKVLYVGDLNQLSPIKGPTAPNPEFSDYWHKLTKIYRNQDSLLKPLHKLVRIIEDNEKISYLEPTEDFKRGIDIDKAYLASKSSDKIMLAYTNKAVQAHNLALRDIPSTKLELGDILYSSSLREVLSPVTRIETLQSLEDPLIGLEAYSFITANGNLTYQTKYNPLEILKKIKGLQAIQCDNQWYLVIFGSYNNKIVREVLGKNLVAANINKSKSKDAFKRYKAVNDFVLNVDLNFCMTIHKSQGSEYEEVYIDSKDLSLNKNLKEQLKLLYVAMSRAKSRIFLNN